MTEFLDRHGDAWTLSLNAGMIARIGNLKDKNGKSINIFTMVENADFSQLKDVETLIRVAFNVLLGQINENFNLEDYDAENSLNYEISPELINESRIKKAFRWFCGCLDGRAINDLTDALMEEIVNFSSNPERQAAIRDVINGEKELENHWLKEWRGETLSKMDKVKAQISQQVKKVVAEKTEKLQFPQEP